MSKTNSKWKKDPPTRGRNHLSRFDTSQRVHVFSPTVRGRRCKGARTPNSSIQLPCLFDVSVHLGGFRYQADSQVILFFPSQKWKMAKMCQVFLQILVKFSTSLRKKRAIPKKKSHRKTTPHPKKKLSWWRVATNAASSFWKEFR